MQTWARRTRISLFALAATVWLSLPSAASAGTLDQQQTAVDNTAFGLYQSVSGAQTFTAGLTGGLDRADLMLAAFGGTPPAYLTVEIRDVSGGVPGQAILAARSIPPSTVTNSTPQFIPVQFNPPAPVIAGTQYAIVAYSGNSSSAFYTWYVKNTNVYPGGQAFNSVTPPSSSWNSDPTQDLGFKTYVVPTPTSAAATGQRAAALKKCKKKHSKAKRRKCRKKANLLPV